MKKSIFTILFISLWLTLLPMTHTCAVQANAEVRGVWIASVGNIDFPSKPGLSMQQQKKEIDQILDNAQYMGLNAVFFQVRPSGDALYKSDIFPWSAYLTGQQGKANDQGFDPLKYIIEQGHKRGIKIHAWINPLRVLSGSADTTKLAPNNPAMENPSLVVSHNGSLYYDPGNPQTIKLIVSGILEIVKNYDIDGIHFDDYFYPSKEAVKDKNGNVTYKDFDDSASYSKYKGSYKTKEDWRRGNIDNLIKSVYTEIKKADKTVEFGVSPFAVWAGKNENKDGSDTSAGLSTYYDSYADTRKWVKEKWIDYIAPQIYWNIGYPAADYEVLLKWWEGVCSDSGVKLIVGHAAYKINDGTQSSAWLDAYQIPMQINMNRSTGKVSGSIFYGYSKLINNTLGIKEWLRNIYVNNADPIIRPSSTKELRVITPGLSYSTTAANISILGSCDPAYPLLINNKNLKCTQNGYFATYQPLSMGENIFQLTNNGKTIRVTVTRMAQEKAQNKFFFMGIPKFKDGSLLPMYSVTGRAGHYITFSCIAPAGAKVWVEIGNYKVSLRRDPCFSPLPSLMPAEFEGTFILPDNDSGELLNIGSPVFVLKYNEKIVTQKTGNMISVQPDKYSVATVNADEAMARAVPEITYSKHAPLVKGVSDYIYGQEDDNYILRCGIRIPKTSVEISDKTLNDNKISAVKISVDNTYTSLKLKMPVFAPYTVEKNGNKIVLTVFNTYGRKSGSAPDNSFISEVQYKRIGSDAAQYILTLKNKDSYYGYSMEYEQGYMVLSLKNPPSPQGSETPLSGTKVLLDPGHGVDCGAIGPNGSLGPNENNLNLTAAMYARDYLTASGANVIMTRTSDVKVELNDRVVLIRKEAPDIAVSIHTNSLAPTSDYAQTKGLMVFYSMSHSKSAAQYFEDCLTSSLGRENKGARYQSLAVCRVTQCPSILIEMGFISNPQEYEWMSDPSNIKQMGNEIGKTIEKWLLAQK